MKKMKRIIRKIVCIVAAGLVVLIGLALMVQALMTAYEKKKYPCQGTYVNVNGENMCISVRGSGEKTIVLLPGLGTTAPILDFEPLAKQLEQYYRVVIVEPFGYGWSEITKKERTIEHEVEELHQALQKSGVTGPYLLMPHSIYGLDSIRYANQYPEETAGIIGIDCTLPAMNDYFQEEVPKKVPEVFGGLYRFGVMRVLSMIEPEQMISDNSKGIYSEANLRLQRILAAQKAQNRDIVDQNNHISDSIEKTKGLQFSSSLPLLFFTRASKEDDLPGKKTSKSFYETYISNPEIQRVVTMEAGHYMHWTCSDEMVQKIVELFPPER